MSPQKPHFCQLTKDRDNFTIRPNIWQKLKEKWRQVTSVSPQHPFTSCMFRSSYTIRNEQIRHQFKENRHTIHPYSMFNFFWRVIMMFTIIIVVALDIYDVSVETNLLFYAKNGTDAHQIIIDSSVTPTIFNLICIIDIGFNFITGYVETSTTSQFVYSTGIQATKTKNIVLDKGKIALRYCRTYLLVDLIAFENMVVLIIFSNLRPITLNSYVTAGYAVFFFKLFRFIRFISVMKTMRMIISGITVTQYVYQITVCVFFIMYSVFIFGCIHLAVPDMIWHFTNISFNDGVNIPEKIRRGYKIVGHNVTNFELAVNAMHFSCGLILGNPIPDLGTEVVANVISLIAIWFGFILRAWFLLLILALFTTTYRSWLAYTCFLTSIKKYMKQTHLTDETQHKIFKYLEQTLKLEKFYEADILDAFDKRIKYEIFTKSSMGLIRKCHLFRNLPNDVVSSLAFSLKYETYVPGQQIMKVGEFAGCMYFIASGSVAVYNKKGREMAHLSDGDYVGEIGLIFPRRGRTADIITIEETKMYRLGVKDFQKIIKPKSKLHAKLKRTSTMRTLRKSNIQ